MFLQFYTLLRSTRSSSIWSLCISMPLSILGIAKHVHATFELQILEVVTRHPTQPSQPELQTTPLQSGHSNTPAAGPWRSGGESLAMQGSPYPPGSTQVIPDLPPGIAPRAELLPTLPPGIAPRAGPAAMRGSPCPPPDSMQVIPALPPGIAPRAELLPTLPPGIPPRGALLPITVGSSKAKDTE